MPLHIDSQANSTPPDKYRVSIVSLNLLTCASRENKQGEGNMIVPVLQCRSTTVSDDHPPLCECVWIPTPSRLQPSAKASLPHDGILPKECVTRDQTTRQDPLKPGPERQSGQTGEHTHTHTNTNRQQHHNLGILFLSLY